MNQLNENIDPHSLPNLAHLLSNSANKRSNPKLKANKLSPSASGLRDSLLHNLAPEHGNVLVDHLDAQLPTPPSSQSMTDRPTTVDTRLPISPPPEEEIRIKELSAHGHTPKQPQSRLPLPSRAAPSAAFKFPPAPQSFTQYQQRIQQAPTGGPASTTLATTNAAARANPRKRARSAIPPPTLSVPPAPTETAVNDPSPPSTTVAHSPNPKPRKQHKVHAAGVYTGSGFKRRHKRGTSSESLDAGDGTESVSLNLASPARKKRTNETGAEDYTPQREHALASAKKESLAKSKARARRSATPEVRYEPPSEQFTPPRTVVRQPPSSTTSTRSRNLKPSSSAQPVPSSERRGVRVKPERLTSPFPLPRVDLSKPVPPPSPTEDPILLIGPPVVARRSETPSGPVNKTFVDTAVGSDNGHVPVPQEPSLPARISPSTNDHEADESRWGMPSQEETALMDVAFDGPSHFEATFDPDSDSDGDRAFDDNTAVFNCSPSPPLVNRFDPNQSTGSHIFHSDDEEAEAGEDEGEYTGRFKFYSVPVKQDPPSSATRARRDSWGRPISPFPFKRRSSGPPQQEEDEQVPPDDESPPPSPSEGRKRSGTSRPSSRAVSPNYSTRAQDFRVGGFTLSEMEDRLVARKGEKGDTVRAQHEGDARTDNVGAHVENEEASSDDEDEEVESVEREVTPVDEEAEHIEGPGLPGYTNNHVERAGPKPQDEQSEDEFDVEPPTQVEHSDHSEDGESMADQRVQFASPSCSTLAHHSEHGPITSTSLRDASLFTEHYVAIRDDDNDELEVVNDHDDDSASSDDDTPALGVVEISSDDPKAAARAAAILKLHHSYILDGVVAQRARRRSAHQSRRASFAFGDGDVQESEQTEDAIRRARRKSIANTGGVLQFRPRQTSHSPLARSVFIAPGSPAASTISAEDALREAETQIRAASASPGGPKTPVRPSLVEIESPQTRLVTPSSVSHHMPSLLKDQHQQPIDKREWTKADWKRLDSCFTDERLAMGQAVGLEDQMADVGDVEIDAVVNRFLIDAPEVGWDRDMLHRRATALSNRQRSGHGAPPSPGRLTQRRSGPEVTPPTFTPSAASRTPMPPPEVGLSKKLPASLLAPRYAHLHEEAGTVVVEQSSSSSKSITQEVGISVTEQLVEDPTEKSAQPSTPQPTRPDTYFRPGRHAVPLAAPASTTKRVLGYLGSFLGRGGGVAPTTKPTLKPTHSVPSMPPPEMRQTVRGPVTTPAKKPIPKSQAPREFVRLAETQVPSKPTAVPRAKSAKEMVNLNHIDPPRSVQRPRTASGPILIPGRTRADSGGSVKDLVRSFEQVQKRTQDEMTKVKGKMAMRKVASVGDLHSRTPWRP